MRTFTYFWRQLRSLPAAHKVVAGVVTATLVATAVAVPIALRPNRAQNLNTIRTGPRNPVSRELPTFTPGPSATPEATSSGRPRVRGGTTGTATEEPEPPEGTVILPPTHSPGGGENKGGTSDPFAYDASRPLSPTQPQAVDAGGGRPFDAYAFQLSDADGKPVNTRFTVPRNNSHEGRCVIYAHGHGPQFPNNSASSVVNDGGGGVGDIFWDRAAVIGIDARGHGARKGNVSYESMIRDTVRDMRRVLDYLRSRNDVCNSARIGVVGFSMGGETAIVFGAVEKNRLNVVAELGAGGDWKCHGFSDAEATRLAYMDPVNNVGKISPKHVIMANGDNDQVWKKECAEKLHAAAKDPKEVIWWNGGHTAPDATWQDVATRVVAKL